MPRPRRLAAALGLVLGLAAGATAPPAAAGGPAVAVDGLWVGKLRIGGEPRTVALLLHPRGSGEVYGYVLGGGSALTVSDGRLAGARLRLRLHAANPGGTRTLLLDGTVAGATFTGTATTGGVARPLTLRRRSAAGLVERRVAFVDPGAGAGGRDALTEMAVALDGSGRVLAGSWVAHEACAALGCGGGVQSLAETAAALEIGFSRPGCGGGSRLRATFDATTQLYSASFTLAGCAGGSGSLIGGRGTRSRAEDVAGMLATLARLADDLAARRPLAAPYPPFFRGYLHSGTKLAPLLAQLSAQSAGHDPFVVSFDRFRNASSIDDPTTLPPLDRPFGIDFHDRRVGTPVGGGAPAVVRDSDMETLLVRELAIFRRTAAGWVIAGDQLPALDLPFAYQAGPSFLKTATPGGAVYVTLGPWGAHLSPHTGHAYGDAKANLVGFLAWENHELVELVGNGNGVREAGEVWGYWGGGDGSRVRDRVPLYRSPYAGRITRIEYAAGPSGAYFDDAPHWLVDVQFPNDLRLSLGHLGRLAPALRAALLAATGIDSDTYAGPPRELLGGRTLPVARHAPLAWPQVMAAPIVGHPGHYRGGGTFPEVPWAQMEFRFEAPVGESHESVCGFDHLPPAARATLAGVLAADLLDPRSRRYTTAAGLPPRWQWAAEGVLCLAYSPLPRGFGSLHTELGGWFERPAPGTTADEIFAVVRIATDGVAYDPSLYAPGVRHLVVRRRRAGDGAFAWPLPGGAMARPFYPTGEVIEETASTLLLRWRDLVAAGDAFFQRASFRLDTGGLAVRWGVLAATAAAAPPPAAIAAGEPCDDVALLCYDHTYRPGF